MNETKTLNEWVWALGFSWVEGREVMLKGELTREQATEYISQLVNQGAIE